MYKKYWKVKGYINHEYGSVVVKARNKTHARKVAQKSYTGIIITSIEEVIFHEEDPFGA